MNSVTLLLAASLAVASAQLVYRQSPATTSYYDTRDEYGQLSLRYATDNGITVTETGHLKPLLTRGSGSDVVYVKEGSYSFTSPEGNFYKVDYVADENGYRATGAHLPVAPTYNPFA